MTKERAEEKRNNARWRTMSERSEKSLLRSTPQHNDKKERQDFARHELLLWTMEKDTMRTLKGEMQFFK